MLLFCLVSLLVQAVVYNNPVVFALTPHSLISKMSLHSVLPILPSTNHLLTFWSMGHSSSSLWNSLAFPFITLLRIYLLPFGCSWLVHLLMLLPDLPPEDEGSAEITTEHSKTLEGLWKHWLLGPDPKLLIQHVWSGPDHSPFQQVPRRCWHRSEDRTWKPTALRLSSSTFCSLTHPNFRNLLWWFSNSHFSSMRHYLQS